MNAADFSQMRSNGVEEKYITGDASDREKFQKWAETLEKLIGNPLYHWSHLEVWFFDIHSFIWSPCWKNLYIKGIIISNLLMPF